MGSFFLKGLSGMLPEGPAIIQAYWLQTVFFSFQPLSKTPQ